ncbi:hypothetical protein PFICI_08038 [Pestalotiopsis fici W106-1]|uniref:Cas1p 10 TM acyl transferase domain-containing protein n=1 Tax=Pestalotiopsis fici (strain W106-1 / CGMCC3.15140) TaxID=1229662 RepID=W3X3C5_PESFW|nr:uncharacterized protein PFICI_08038 [Pestalotiopsis fici W106-1]ETS80509.1 hypothetical protein PFICI_08038 [Pestalotiopsis fici W106-1]
MPPEKIRRASEPRDTSRGLPPTIYRLAVLLIPITIAIWCNLAYLSRNDPFHCRTLLSDGAWASHTGPRDPEQDFAKWEPHNCRMIEYSRGQFHDCLGGRRVVFAGDSTMRQVYWAAATRLDHMKAHVALLDVVVDDSKHDNLYFEAEGVKLEFVWDPWLNSSYLHDELLKFRAQETFADYGVVKSKDEESAALVVLGAPGLWAARHGGDDYFAIFKRGIEAMRIHFGSTLQDSLVSPTKDFRRNNDLAPNQILLAPVQEPWYDSLSADRAQTIKPEKVDRMNAYLAKWSSEEQSHILWAYNQMTKGDESAYEVNGIHVLDRIAERKIDIALNARCNSATGHRIPQQASCCVRYPKLNMLQKSMIAAAFILAIVLGVRHGVSSLFSLRSDNIPGLVFCILAILVYCHVTDRRHEFLRLDRHYDSFKFLMSCCIFWATSLLSWRSDSQPADQVSKSRRESTVQNDKGFLSREQSNEWKGWMQCLILIYHFNYASQTLWVYKLIRVLVSAYIFLSGYGHTMYLLKTEDFSFRRVAATLFRLNFLSAVLPYMMSTSYNFYYFAPIITFWYLVVYVTLRVFKRYNQDPLKLLVKLVLAAIIATPVIFIPQPLQLLSTICRVVFHSQWDSKEVSFRLRIDRYIVFFGMMTASIVHRMSVLRANSVIPEWSQLVDPRVGDSSAIDPLLAILEFPDALSKPIKPLACGCAALFILCFTTVTQTAIGSKEMYNAVHALTSWVPIISFLILRNSHRRLRNAHLALPAAFGGISLELYILQYHIWLGGDATAKLSMGLGDRFGSRSWLAVPNKYLEPLLIGGMFICISVYARYATEALTKRLFYSTTPHEDVNGDSGLASKERAAGGGQYAEAGWLSKSGQLVRMDVRATVLGIVALVWLGNMIS